MLGPFWHQLKTWADRPGALPPGEKTRRRIVHEHLLQTGQRLAVGILGWRVAKAVERHVDFRCPEVALVEGAGRMPYQIGPKERWSTDRFGQYRFVLAIAGAPSHLVVRTLFKLQRSEEH